MNGWSSNYPGEIRLFSLEEFKERFGRGYDLGKDFIGVMNGDSYGTYEYLSSVLYYGDDGFWVKTWSGKSGGYIRLNYVVVLGD